MASLLPRVNNVFTPPTSSTYIKRVRVKAWDVLNCEKVLYSNTDGPKGPGAPPPLVKFEFTLRREIRFWNTVRFVKNLHKNGEACTRCRNLER